MSNYNAPVKWDMRDYPTSHEKPDGDQVGEQIERMQITNDDIKMIALLSMMCVLYESHSVKNDEGRSVKVRCLEDNCPFCRTGKRKQKEFIFHCFDVIEEVPCLLPVTESKKRTSLFAQLMKLIGEHSDDDGQLVLEIYKPDQYSFSVKEAEIDRAKMNKKALEDATTFIGGEGLDYSHIVLDMTEAEILSEFPSVARNLRIKGYIG